MLRSTTSGLSVRVVCPRGRMAAYLRAQHGTPVFCVDPFWSTTASLPPIESLIHE